MPTVKTAISIESGLYHKVDQLSRRLSISRSSFFSQAARYMIEKNANVELLQKINAAVEHNPIDHDETLRRRHEKAYRRRVVDKW